jgi:ubiquinone/menaquinone biosynthesis C-methylase UbiE
LVAVDDLTFSPDVDTVTRSSPPQRRRRHSAGGGLAEAAGAEALVAGLPLARKKGSAMELAHSRHQKPDPRTPGILIGQGRGHETCTAVFFAGRRRRVFTGLAAASGAGPPDRVLDVGCGTGYLTRVMAEAVAPGGTAHGVDPSDEAIAHARRLTRLANCTFSDGIAEALDAPDGAYDVVVTSLMIHHLPETLRPRAIGEMFRVLRPGGSILIAEFRPPASRIGRRMIRAHSPAMANNRVDLLEPMVREAGFEQLRSDDLRPWMHYVQALRPTAGA